MATTTTYGQTTTTSKRNRTYSPGLYWGIAAATLIILAIAFSAVRTRDLPTTPSGVMSVPADNVAPTPATPAAPYTPQDSDIMSDTNKKSDTDSTTRPERPTETKPNY